MPLDFLAYECHAHPVPPPSPPHTHIHMLCKGIKLQTALFHASIKLQDQSAQALRGCRQVGNSNMACGATAAEMNPHILHWHSHCLHCTAGQGIRGTGRHFKTESIQSICLCFRAATGLTAHTLAGTHGSTWIPL